MSGTQDEPETSRSTREKLLDAAIEVFTENGFEGTRVAEIARRAGLTTGAIYGRFETKGDLLAEAIAAKGGDSLRFLHEGRPGDLATLVRQLVGKGTPEHKLVIDMFSVATRDDTVAARVDRVLDRADGRIEESVRAVLAAEGADAEGLVEPIRYVIQLMVLGAIVNRGLGRKTPRSQDLTHVLATMFASLIESPDRGRS